MIDLVTRRAYFDDYADTIEQLPPSLVQYGVRFSCPCCGYPTLGQRGVDGICPICWWEDDGQDDPDSDVVRTVKWDVRAAFDAMPTTPMTSHEPLWAAVVAGMQKLRALR